MVPLGTQVRVDVTLPVGGLQDRVEVTSGTSVLNTTATQEHGITPETLQQLPLMMNSGPRAAAGFAILMPGVSTGGGSNAFDARINGGLQSGDEATVDGVSMQQGFMSQGGMVSIFQDFPMSPDMVSEVKVLTSNYAPEYGSSTSGQIMAVTRSGGSSFHGAGFIYHRDDSLKATQWGADSKPEFNRNNYGANIGGPAKLPGLWNDKVKSFFFFNYEGYRQTGGSNAPTLSIPSLRQRNGDFTDWRDSSGNLIPIYDPATIRPDGSGGFIKDQFMGCDGRTPNVICPSRINPIVRAWLDALPNPTSDGPLNNYLGPAIPDTILGNSDYYLGRYDLQFASSDHMFASFWHQRAPAKFASVLPQSIANETYSDPQNSWVNRFNWDRTFSPTLLNHMSMGYLNRNEGYGSVNQEFVGDFPQIAGVAGHNVPPQMSFGDDFAQFGNNAGVNVGNITTRPTFIINDMVTWTRGAHTLKSGWSTARSWATSTPTANQAGTLQLPARCHRARRREQRQPDRALPARRRRQWQRRRSASVDSSYPRQTAWILHAGDTWRVNNRFTLDYGLRWDYYSPSSEKYDRFSFFDPIGANPGAGGRPGRLAFAGDSYGAASYGARYPEEDWYGGFAPRLGAVYSLNDKTVLRTGWGIFYTQAFYPGWGGGISQDGFSNSPRFSSTLGGIQPAFYLDQGLPQNFTQPPDIRSDYRNGQGILYRPLDANERSYAHQWNISVDRELGANLSLSVAYVGSAGRRLPSSIEPLNAIDPGLPVDRRPAERRVPAGHDEPQRRAAAVPGLGRADDRLRAVGGAGAPSLPAVLRQPPGPERELRRVAVQLAADEAREALLGRHLRARVLHAVEDDRRAGRTTRSATPTTWSGLQGVISPFEQERNKAMAVTDTPHVLSVAFVYELPFGEGKKWANTGGLANALVGGWQVSTIFRYSSGLPFFFRSSFCNVPGQFRAGCIPAIVNPSAVFAQDKGNFDPDAGPLFNAGGLRVGGRVQLLLRARQPRRGDVRGFGFHNQDLSFIKNTRMSGNTNLQFRVEMFNVWNWHIFSESDRQCLTGSPSPSTSPARTSAGGMER